MQGFLLGDTFGGGGMPEAMMKKTAPTHAKPDLLHLNKKHKDACIVTLSMMIKSQTGSCNMATCSNLSYIPE